LVGLPSDTLVLPEVHPVGLSFYTFTKIAYLVDVYWRVIPAVTNPITFGTFIAFFPNITSGPIERAAHLLPQLQATVTFDYDRVVSGCRLLLWGCFKKMVIADTLAHYVNAVYAAPQAYSGAVLLCATLFLAFQIYADFSGYTDMARGIARILGIHLFENFRQPYFAQSVTEFWRSWHISLSNWIRELMFVPLSRLLMRRNQNLSPRILGVIAQLIVMALVGLWHGAALTFVVWGVLHGIYLSVEAWFRRPPSKKAEAAWRPLWRMLRTFMLVALAWIFFRATSLEDAVYILTHLPILTTDNPAGISLFGRLPFLLNFGLIALLLYTDWLERTQPIPDRLAHQRLPVRWLLYYGLTCGILGVIILNTTPPPLFIYFAF
jgi:D-alanyl-lipoteichoic acid acyltransferase DltB (MBOAT superfamily)